MKALEQNKSFNKNDAVTYHVVDVAGRRSMAEDIWGGVSTAISRRRGMPDDHVEGGHVKGGHVMPFQACGAVAAVVTRADSLLASQRVAQNHATECARSA